MNAVVINSPYQLEIVTIPKPILSHPFSVMIQLKAAGICGSDIHIYHGENAAATYPRIIGHEMIGEIVEMGSSVTKVKLGDRVIVNQVISCGKCYACQNNRSNVCKELQVRGVHTDGGFQEFLIAPEEDVFIIPEKLSYTEAVMIEPLTIAIQSCERANLVKEDTLLILGCGALGTSILKIAKLSGAKIIVADIFEDKLNQALALGADFVINIKDKNLELECKKLTNGYGPTVSIDAACTKNTLSTLINITGNAGRVITMGFSIEDSIGVTQFGITSKELDIRGSRLQNKKLMNAIQLIEENKIDLSGSISHTFHFLEAKKAFDFLDTKDSSIKKVVLTFE